MLEIRRYLKGTPLLLPFLGAIITGIVSNRLDAILLVSTDFLVYSLSIEVWIIAAIVTCSLIPSTIWGLIYFRAHKVSVNLNELDDSVLRLLRQFRQSYNTTRSVRFNPFSSSNGEADKALKRLLREFLERVLDVFYLFHGCGAEIWRPTEDDPENLSLWCHENIQDTTRTETKFYIGSPLENIPKRGLAGHVFIDGETDLVHLDCKNGVWTADKPDKYRYLRNRESNSFQYRSLIAVPIKIAQTDNNETVLGVLCLYSLDRSAFDSMQVQRLLVSIADKIASILVIAGDT